MDLQLDNVVVSRPSKPERVAQNLDVFDFTLEPEHMEAIEDCTTAPGATRPDDLHGNLEVRENPTASAPVGRADGIHPEHANRRPASCGRTP